MFSWGPTDKNLSLDHVMAWHWTGDKPFTWTNDNIVIWRKYAPLGGNVLTHWGRMTHTCVGELTTIGSGNGLSPGRRQAIYLNQCWHTINSNLRNKFQWNRKRNSYILIQENVFENVVCEIASILPRPQCVNRSLSTCMLAAPLATFARTVIINSLYLFAICIIVV